MEHSSSEYCLCNRMRLWEFPDQYVIEPADGGHHQLLSISRVDGALQSIGEMPFIHSSQVPKTQTIFGLVGIIKLFAGAYALVITARECVGSYGGHPIYKVVSMRFLPCNSALKKSTPQEKKAEADFANLLRAAEKIPGLYFSYDVELTLNAQRSYHLEAASKMVPLWKQADTKYLWNRRMIEELTQHKLDRYILPVIQGSFQTFQTVIGKTTLNVTLIARRCMHRTGTRMWRRGADLDGNVANFVETEQILEANGYLASYVQVRGSIPLLWEQVVDLTYKPGFKLINLEDAPKVVERHFSDLRRRYGSVTAVDLVNQHGREGLLSQAYANAVQALVNDEIRYVQFDFHRVCGHVHFERLSLLYDQIADDVKKHSYFLLSIRQETLGEQKGVIRSNCIDCLDRTNVTQSMLGRKSMEAQLQRIEIFRQDETINQHMNFDNLFKILWANHGDEISIQYSGTPALKGDFVRHGQRTIQGILGDGHNALARYYFNNFCDGVKQDAIDLLQGHYTLSREISSPSQGRGLATMASVPLASALVLASIVLATMSLRQGRQDSRRFIFSAFWASLALGIVTFVRINGRVFCNRPRLQKLL